MLSRPYTAIVSEWEGWTSNSEKSSRCKANRSGGALLFPVKWPRRTRAAVARCPSHGRGGSQPRRALSRAWSPTVQTGLSYSCDLPHRTWTGEVSDLNRIFICVFLSPTVKKPRENGEIFCFRCVSCKFKTAVQIFQRIKCRLFTITCQITKKH